MASFSNGTSGMAYQDRYCNHCIHDINEDCPIWLLHLLWNSEQIESINAVYNGAALDTNTASGAKHMALSHLIPDGDDGYPGQCSMFVAVAPPERGGEGNNG